METAESSNIGRG